MRAPAPRRPRPARPIVLVVAFLVALLGAGASAARESVGQASFDLPMSEWKLVAGFEQALHYSNGREIALFNKLYLLPGEGAQPRALLMVTSTSGSHGGKTQWVSEVCPEPRAKFFTADYGSNKLTAHRECVVVNPGFVAATYFRDMAPVTRVLAEQGIELPRRGVSIRSLAANENGALLRVNFIAFKDFVGLPAEAPAASDLHEVAPALVAWAEALHSSVKSASRRVSGRLELPPMEFER